MLNKDFVKKQPVLDIFKKIFNAKQRGCYKIYQREWNGISLVQIAKENNIPLKSLVAADLYREFYLKLKENGYQLGEAYKSQKQNIGKWYREYIDKIEIKLGRKANIVSIGCGLGIVEESLIKNNYHIELQECQEASFEYLNMKGCHPKKCWVTNDISDLPSNTYDLVIVNMVVYAFEDEAYLNLLKNINRILIPAINNEKLESTEGVVVIIEPQAVFLQKVYAFLRFFKRKIIGGAPDVFWGWIRSRKTHKYFAKKAGLRLVEEFELDHYGNQTQITPTINGYSLNTSNMQGFVFKKQ